jgi:ATP-dependent RNA helicase DHX29
LTARSIDTDFLLIVLRSLIMVRPELKVVLMSATVDAERFSSYLNGAPVLTVPGRTFPVHTKYLEDAIELTSYTTSTESDQVESITSEDEEHIVTVR